MDYSKTINGLDIGIAEAIVEGPTLTLKFGQYARPEESRNLAYRHMTVIRSYQGKETRSDWGWATGLGYVRTKHDPS